MLVKALSRTLWGCTLFWAINSNAQFSNYRPPMQEVRGSRGINLYVGGNTFLGDLGGTRGKGKPFIKDFNGKTIRPYLGAGYTYFPLSYLSLTGGIQFTWVTGADSLIKEKTGNAYGRYLRNLSFRSPITEVTAGAEFYPLQTIMKYEEAIFRPYVGVGLGAFHFNPKAKLNGQWVRLKPLHLEGQGFAEYPERKEYKRTQVFIPITVGMRYRIDNNIVLSLSAVFRKTFTDYIDDVGTDYIDPSLFDKYLSPSKAALAKQLYNRENPASIWYHMDPNRGDDYKDSYTSVFFTVTYLFDKRHLW